jgi:hypothetical protein
LGIVVFVIAVLKNKLKKNTFRYNFKKIDF